MITWKNAMRHELIDWSAEEILEVLQISDITDVTLDMIVAEKAQIVK